MAVIAYGRIGVFDSKYLGASRYTVETTLILCGVLYIQTTILTKKQILKIIKTTAWIISIGFVMGIFVSDFTELKTAPYRQHYKSELAAKLWEIDNAEDKDLAGLQADVSFVRTLVPILEQRKLSMWTKEYGIVYLYGISEEDFWVEEDAALKLKSGKKGIIKIEGYNPNVDKMTNAISEIYINGNRYGECVLKAKFKYDFEVPKNEIIEIKFITKKAVQAPVPDVRRLAFKLEKIEMN